jgi:hydrogenase expression/formation protein HypC
MCVAFPGKVVEIGDGVAKVDFNGSLVDIRVGLVDVSLGQYVLAHAGCAIEAMSEEKAMEILEIFKDVEGAYNE